MSTNRRIAHLDMDAFYASVELLRYPQLKGLPVVIGGGRRTEDVVLAHGASLPIEKFPRLKNYSGRGVVTTATYAARQFGIGSAMGLMKAAKLYPDAILLPVDFEEVRKYSRRFKSIVLQNAPVMQDRGIDEVYIDFTHASGGQEQGGLLLAKRIQKGIFEETQLTCSIGVAPNKLLAKMASEMNKPNGITVLYENDLRRHIWVLDCRKINGIGPKAYRKLNQLGINTIGELALYDRQLLLAQFGKNYGAWLHEVAWGRDDTPVLESSEPVSMSRETTFEKDLDIYHDRAQLHEIFVRLCRNIANDLKLKGYFAKTIGVKIKYADFKTITRDATQRNWLNQASDIERVARSCLKRVTFDQPLRLLGVKASTLAKITEIYPTSNVLIETKGSVCGIIENINDSVSARSFSLGAHGLRSEQKEESTFSQMDLFDNLP